MSEVECGMVGVVWQHWGHEIASAGGLESVTLARVVPQLGPPLGLGHRCDPCVVLPGVLKCFKTFLKCLKKRFLFLPENRKWGSSSFPPTFSSLRECYREGRRLHRPFGET